MLETLKTKEKEWVRTERNTAAMHESGSDTDTAAKQLTERVATMVRNRGCLVSVVIRGSTSVLIADLYVCLGA